MQCQEIHRLLREGKMPSDERALQHLAICEACQLLTDEHGALAAQLFMLEAEAIPTMDPSTLSLPSTDDLFADLQQQIGEEQQSLRQRMRQLPLWSQYSILTTLILLMFGFVLLFKARPDWAAYPSLRMWLSLTGFLALLGTGVWIAQRPIYKARLPQFQIWTVWGLSLILPLLLALLPEVHTGHAAAAGHKGFWHHTLACFGYGIGNAMPLMLLGSMLARDRLPQESFVTLALAGGMLGNIALQIHCPMTSQLHLGLSHAAVGVVLLISSLLLSRRRQLA